MNAAIELHDSEVVAVERADDAVVVRLVAYVHRSAGRPGFDSGTVWSQPVELVFSSGVIVEQPRAFPWEMDGGGVSGGVEFDGLVPLPASVRSPVRFTACGVYGESLEVRAAGLAVVATADGSLIETFPGIGPA